MLEESVSFHRPCFKSTCKEFFAVSFLSQGYWRERTSGERERICFGRNISSKYTTRNMVSSFTPLCLVLPKEEEKKKKRRDHSAFLPSIPLLPFSSFFFCMLDFFGM